MAHDHTPAHGHASADDEYLPVEGSNYEHTDAHTRPIAQSLFWLTVIAFGAHAIMAGAYALFISRAEAGAAAERRYPLAANEYQLPPAPRLQQFPQNERYIFQRDERRLLESYGWSNKAAGTVYIPIDEAMRLAVERGMVPSRPAAEASAPAGMMPADSSAGRTFERRRQ